jgi:polyisoprenoid-binding protein YceI
MTANHQKGDHMKTLAMITAAALAGLALPAAAAPVSYTLDPDHTIPRFEVMHNHFSNHIGAFMKSAGKAMLDVEAKTGSVEVTIQTASFMTGHEFMEKFSKSKEFFDVEQFPTMTFKSTRMTFAGDKPATVEGNFTLLGITRPITLTVTNFNCAPHPRNKKEQCGGNLTGQIKRSDYGMKAFIPVVGDDVKLMIQVESFKD